MSENDNYCVVTMKMVSRELRQSIIPETNKLYTKRSDVPCITQVFVELTVCKLCVKNYTLLG